MRKIIGVHISLQIQMKKNATRINAPYISHISMSRSVSKLVKGKTSEADSPASATY